MALQPSLLVCAFPERRATEIIPNACVGTRQLLYYCVGICLEVLHDNDLGLGVRIDVVGEWATREDDNGGNCAALATLIQDFVANEASASGENDFHVCGEREEQAGEVG
jgi:hypothetical protein